MATFKVVLTDFGSPENELEAEVLRNSGLDIVLVRLNARTPDALFPEVEDADALLVQWVNINADVIRRLRKCKIISRYGIGVDMIDLQAAGERGIPVCNVGDYCIEEVSTHTLGFLLMLNRRLLIQHQHVMGGKWGGIPGGAPERLSSQTIGVVGLGNIGRAVAQKAAALGLRVIAHDPYLSANDAKTLGIELLALDDLLHRSDYVAVHCPLTPETRHLFGEAQFGMMKPTAYLINMARGPIVDQVALHTALSTGQIAGAALDVLDKEPPTPDDPLLTLDNVLITPHTSSWSTQGIVALRCGAAENIVTVLRGDAPRFVVNRHALRPVPSP